ncbi:prolyl 4-hydroxylase [Seiridium cupressi]
MSKSKKAAKRKRQNDAQVEPSNKKRVNAPPTPDSSDGVERVEPTSLHAVVPEDDVEITVDTLRTLAAHPAVIKSKACKDLRTAVYDFRQACTTGVNTTADTNLTSRISAALVDGKYTDALVLLAEMRLRGESPKLGALCRWVRDLDVTSGFSMRNAEQIQRSKGQLERLRLLDAISRVTGTVDLNPSISFTKSSDPFILHTRWNLHEDPVLSTAATTEAHLSQCRNAGVKDKFKVLEVTRGAERKPPNLHDAVLYLSDDNAVPLSSNPPKTTHHKHPAVPNLSLMKDVLSQDECKSIVATMETVGFLPDAPVRDDGAEASILAHNVYWIVDQAFHDSLWHRVKSFIPAEVGGRKARGINRRFRVYRYVPGAEYRVHFDGAWPPSGVHPTTGQYLWDASPSNARQSSLFTFLVYLNDDFEGGETTFFTPSLVEGVMNAHPVRPMMGSIALFPHGESAGALLHEGTGVRKGAKYIIRTDVEYDVEPGRSE